MAGDGRMTLEAVVANLLEGEHGDFVREAVAIIARELRRPRRPPQGPMLPAAPLGGRNLRGLTCPKRWPSRRTHWSTARMVSFVTTRPVRLY